MDLAREKNNAKLKWRVEGGIVSLQPKAMMCRSYAAVTNHCRAPWHSGST